MTEAKNGYAQDSYVKESRKRQSDNQDGGRDAKRYNTGTEPLLKLMVPNYVAGALIGKGGACLNEMKEKYGGFIRLSGGREYYPGTDERIVVITGQTSQIIDICNHIIEKSQNPGRDSSMKEVSIDADRAKKVKMILTDSASGMLIGRGGLTIKSIQEESKAKISIAMSDKASVPGERVATISGDLDQMTEACKQIIEKVANETSNMANTKTKYASVVETYSRPGVNAGYGGGGGYDVGHMTPSFNNSHESRNQYPSQYQTVSTKLKAEVQVKVQVPNLMVGGILGKQGSIIKDMVQRSHGAKFKFEEKIDDDTDRTLTITGNMDQAQAAYSLVNERVEQLKSQPTSQGF